MRATILVLVLGIIFSACNKDKYTSAPQITYKSLTTNVFDNSTSSQGPGVVFSLTDAEGDLGDTAIVHIKNLRTGDTLERSFPALTGATKKNLKADVTVYVSLGGCNGGLPGRIDTMYYEIYVTDFAKNRSNTIVTGDPVYQQCP